MKLSGYFAPRILIPVVACLTLSAVSTAHAQAPDPPRHGFVSIGGGFQLGGKIFTASTSQQKFDETAQLALVHEASEGGFLDVSGGVTVWNALAIGVGFTQFKDTNGVTGIGDIPNPLFFDRPRSVSFEDSGFEHREIGINISAVYPIPVTDRLTVTLSGGPTLFRLRQDLVADVELAGATPPRFDRPTVVGTTPLSASGTGWGGHLGVEGTYLLTEQLGVGAFARVTGGSVDLTTETISAIVDVGGPQLGAALTLFF